MERLQVSELKSQLSKRGLDTKGNKSALIERLEAAMEQADERSIVEDVDIVDNVRPEDSVSRVSVAGSTTSSIVLARAKEAGEKAALQARMACIDKRRELLQQELELQREELNINMRREQLKIGREKLELEAHLAATQARDLALSQSGNVEPVPPYSQHQPEVTTGQPIITSGTCQPSHNIQHISDVERGQSGRVAQAMLDHSRRSVLPRVDVPKFGGDCTEFRLFLRAFDARIASHTDDDEEKLHFLDQYVYGKPKDIVRGCLHMAVGGYKEARRLLTQRYGDENVVASAYVDKLLTWPQVKADDVEGLDNLSIFMTGCRNAVDSSSFSSSELNHPKTLRHVCEKLCFTLQDRWRRAVDKIYGEENRQVMFNDLVNFVTDEARIQTNPLFGRQTHTKYPDRTSQRARANLTMDVNPDEPKCMFCDGRHVIQECQVFRQATEPDRREFVLKSGICFICLSKGHMARECPGRAQAGRRMMATPLQASGSSSNDRAVNLVASTTGGSSSGLPLVPVKLRVRGGPPVVTYAFLDSGSSATFCTGSLLDRLGVAERCPTRLSISTVSGEDLMDTYLVTDLQVQDLDENASISLPPVYTLDSIPVVPEDKLSREDVEQWDHLKEVSMCMHEVEAEVGLLIGVNVPSAMEPLDVVASDGGGPFAIRTRLGWVINGPTKQPSKRRTTRIVANRVAVTQASASYHEGIENLATDQCGLSVEDTKWLAVVESECELVDGHYSIPLPLKKKSPSLPNNREAALRRLQALKRKFNDANYADEYREQVEDMIAKGYAEPVPENDIGRCDGKVWFIPHHGVLNPKKGKLRVVFDCASKFRGVCLNDELLAGPNLTNPLLDVLIRFREGKVAFAADIEAMFYQVGVHTADRDYLRFLWWPHGDVRSEPMEYRMTVHLFGASSSPSCASFALRKSALDCEEEGLGRASTAVLRNFYVDDCLCSTETEDEAIQLAHDLQTMCSRGGFRLTKFVSNSRPLLASVNREDRGKQVKELNLNRDTLPAERVLGVKWTVETDLIGLDVGNPGEARTRRSMLALVSSMYDPIGLCAPVLLQGRLVLQEMSRLQLRWDDEAPPILQNRWDTWTTGLHQLSKVSMERCVVPQDFGTIVKREVHHFSDASSKGYGIVAYIRIVNDINQAHSSFLFGKSRLAPIKSVSIPRLELTAATLSVRVSGMLLRALEVPIDSVVFWTDSTTVLRYIHNERTRFHVFVANRLAVIHDGSSPSQWRYVNSGCNPADIASRGQDGASLTSADTWLRGPEFLRHEEERWPQSPEGLTQPLLGDPEVKQSSAVCAVAVRRHPIDVLVSRYSNWARLKRAVAWILRVKRRLVARVRGESVECRVSQPKLIQLEELEEAELVLVRHIQETAYPKELSCLRAGGCVGTSSSISRLDPLIEDGLIKVGGRLSRAGDVPHDRKHPIILPRNGPVVDFIINETHEEVGHEGRAHVLSALRSRYWVVKGCAAVRRVLGRCFSCRRRQRPVMQQKMADLPQDRVAADSPPFTNTGVDYFGPFFVKRGRGQSKKYGVIFTCLACRAVHIEVAESLSTDSFICALRRFISRRGNVKCLRSDRGTNFIGAERELERELAELRKSDSGIHEAMLAKKIKWMFNPPGASNFGGAWERLIRSVRKILDALLSQQVLTEELLQTLLCEVEAVMNSRPLMAVSSDHRDTRPLTPNDLLLLGGNPSVPPGVFRSDDLYRNRRWRQCQYLADEFWRRWKREYMSSLQTRQRWLVPQRNLEEGDVVLIANQAAPRCSWPLGRVEGVRKSDDGLVRSASIRTGGTVLDRPVNKLVLLSDL